MSNNEQAGTATPTPSDELWGDALQEQNAAERSPSAASAGTAATPAALLDDLNLVLDIPVKVTVELGRTRMTINDLLCLSQGAIVTLEGMVGEPLDILINGYLIAQGEVVVVSDKFGIRITEIITPAERIHRLSR